MSRQDIIRVSFSNDFRSLSPTCTLFKTQVWQAQCHKSEFSWLILCENSIVHWPVASESIEDSSLDKKKHWTTKYHTVF